MSEPLRLCCRYVLTPEELHYGRSEIEAMYRRQAQHDLGAKLLEHLQSDRAYLLQYVERVAACLDGDYITRPAHKRPRQTTLTLTLADHSARLLPRSHYDYLVEVERLREVNRRLAALLTPDQVAAAWTGLDSPETPCATS